VRATDNVIEGVDYGVVFATGPDVGRGVIARNRILGARKAIVAFAGATPAGDDLLARGAGTEAVPRLLVSGNRTD
jgi:hypothetical protein